jgi:hypothetical protein
MRGDLNNIFLLNLSKRDVVSQRSNNFDNMLNLDVICLTDLVEIMSMCDLIG